MNSRNPSTKRPISMPPTNSGRAVGSAEKVTRTISVPPNTIDEIKNEEKTKKVGHKTGKFLSKLQREV